MGCCCKEEVDPDESEFDGPQKNRSCTDILCLIIFLTFLGAMFYVLAYAVVTGDPYRVIYGYDVTGDICGTKNQPLKDVSYSGKDLTDLPYLFFDIPRAVQVIGGQALADATAKNPGSGLAILPNNSNKINFCLYGTKTSSPLMASPSVIQLEDNLRSQGDYVIKSERSGNMAMTVVLSKGQMIVYQTDLSNQDTQQSPEQPTEVGLPDTRKVGHYLHKRTANSEVYSDNYQNLTSQLLNYDPVSQILTGGGTCRYCVRQCPGNYTVFFWRCIPSFASTVVDTLFSGTGLESIVDRIIKDIEASWREIIYMCLVAFGLSIVMIVLLRFLAGVIVYIIIVIVALACLAAPTALWLIWYFKKCRYDEQTGNSAANNTTLSNEVNAIASNLVVDSDAKLTQSDVNKYLALAIVGTIIGVIVLLILFALRKRIKLVVQLFFEAGKAVQCMPLILLQPFWTFLSIVIIILSWTIGLLWIESAGYVSQSPDTGFVTYAKNQLLTIMVLFHIFGLFWLIQFVIACQHMVIAGAVSTWYFTRDKSLLHMPVVVAIWRLIRYHLGTVAFGSFIIALVQFIRMILKYLENKIRKHDGIAQMFVCILKCVDCCLWCFEKCMKFINRNAYIEVSIYGVNFCSGAKKAFMTLANNILRVAALNSVGVFVLFLAKVAVVVSTVMAGIQIMHVRPSTEQPVKYEWAPILIAALFAYATSHCFISVYGMAVDTIFICFCEDSDKNDGVKKPYYMSKGLMEYVENSGKALDALKAREGSGKASSGKVINVTEAEH